MKKKMICAVLTLCMVAGLSGMTAAASTEQSGTEDTVSNIALKTSKQSASGIRLSWDDFQDAAVSKYYIMRRNTKNSAGIGDWKMIASVKSDGVVDDALYHYTDRLSSTQPQQYEYKICTLSADKTVDTRDAAYEDSTNASAALGTNIKICIDPGHYGTLNNNYEQSGADGNFPYSEAVLNLQTAEALQTELQQSYGIDSYLTRTSETISLTYNGKKYTNENLDTKNIAVRGYVAKTEDCDFFISLHTNSTSRQTKAWSQPKSINKVFVFVNQLAHTSDRGMSIANTIGKSLTDYNKKAGIQTVGFTARSKNKAAGFSTSINDAPRTKGTVIHRRGSSGSDYYGVLRGANANGVPGILVEHAFHVTQIVRKQAARSTELAQNWAACDAYGLAVGFGLY